MANQINIDIGAAANDGTGDPLRTAFNYVNLNFANVWSTGLPNSNVQFSDNRILTVNTNANLVLAPNGIGIVQANVDIIPSINRGQSLGSATKKWNSVNTYYVNADSANIGSFGNLTIAVANLHITGGSNGYVLQTDGNGNLTWTAQTGGGGNGVPGGANTQVQYNNAGSFGGSASFTFDRTSNVLTVAGNISAGNIAITNLATSNTVFARTATFTGDQFSDGAIYVGTPAGTVLGSDVVMQITANAGGYSQTNFQNINSGPAASSDYILTADNGNDTTHFLDMGITSSGWDGSETNVLSGLTPNNGYLYVQDGNLSLGVRNGNTSYRWNFDTTGNLTVAGNVIPTGNNTQSLGSATRQWNDLYLSNATIYMNSVPISLAAGNVLTVNGADVVTTDANGQANIGNLDITGTYVSIAPGASETIITISPNIEGQAYLQIPNDATANAYDVRIHNDAGNIELGTGGGTNLWYFDNTGNLTMANGGYINFVNTGGITQAVNEDLRFTVSDDEQDGWAIQSTVNDGAGNDLTRMQVRYDGVRINTDLPTNNYSWDFRDSGEFDVPKSIRGPVGGNLVISIGDQSGSNTFIDLQTRSYVGDALISNIRIGDPNVTISTSSGAQNWTFGSTGTLTFPNNGNIRSDAESTVINSTTTANGIVAINARESTFGDWVSQVYLDGTDRLARISTYNPDTEIGYDWTFDAGGSFTLPTAPGNIYMGTNTNGPFISPTSLGITLNANRADETQDYIQVSKDGINLFSVNPIVIDNSTTGLLGTDINITSGDDILLRGRNKPNDSEAEGGDINIYAGTGASAVTEGFDTSSGGDIQIAAGDGGEDTGGGFGGGGGGTMNISAGDGGAGSATTNAGGGGSLSIAAGSAASTANTALGGIGGSISINAGSTTRINELGGTISLNTGAASGDGTGAAGYVEINIPSSNVGAGGTWTFSGTGKELNVPGDSSIYGANFGNFTVGCAGNTIVTSSDYGANVQNWVFGYTGTLTFPDGSNIANGAFNGGTASATVALNAFSPDGNTVSIQAQGNTSSAVISIFANSGPVTNNWTFTQAPLDPTEAFLYVPPGASISTPNATGGEGGKNIFIQAGASDPVTWNSNPGGELMLKGGYGSFGDGGGGPGGNVNISGGESSDSHAGNVNIASGLNTWVFDYSGVLTAPGNIISNIVSATNNDGTGRNIKVGDDTWLGDINISNTLSLRGQQDGTSGYIVFGNASNVKLGRVGTGPLRYEGDFEANGNITAGNNFQLPVYANTTVRDSSIASPSPGMMIYVTGTGMQVRGATSWNTIAGSGT